MMYIATVSAPTNIAVIKYWGKADAEFNTPINDSLSVTLDQQDLRAVTTVAASPDFTTDRLWLNGEEDLTACDNKRFRACIDGVKALAKDEKWKTMKIHVSSFNTFPTAAGLASSAAGYAALVAALAKLMDPVETFPGELTTIARQGSGSASRSLYGGFVAWRKGSAEAKWLDSKAECIQDETHWPGMRALIFVVSALKKDTSSTSGMKTSVQTSRLLAHRAAVVVPERMRHMEQAIHNRDFTTFAELTMQDSNQFHATCLDTYPPIFYMNDVSRSIVRVLTAYNHHQGNGSPRAAYTFDAGPNAVVYCMEEHVTDITALVCCTYCLVCLFLNIMTCSLQMLHYFPTDNINKPELAQRTAEHRLNPSLIAECDTVASIHPTGAVQAVYYTQPGPGPQEVTDICNLDPKTGLNTYVPS